MPVFPGWHKKGQEKWQWILDSLEECQRRAVVFSRRHYIFLVWPKLGGSNLKMWSFFHYLILVRKRRAILMVYGVGNWDLNSPKSQVFPFTIYICLISECLWCSDSSCENVSELAFVILISKNRTVGFYMSQGLLQFTLEVSCLPPKRIII